MSGLKCYRLPEIARNFMQTVKTKFSCRILRHLIRICSVANVIFIGQKHKCVKFYARCAKTGKHARWSIEIRILLMAWPFSCRIPRDRILKFGSCIYLYQTRPGLSESKLARYKGISYKTRLFNKYMLCCFDEFTWKFSLLYIALQRTVLDSIKLYFFSVMSQLKTPHTAESRYLEVEGAV